MAIYDVNGNRLNLGEVEVESYYEAEMADTISKVRTLQTEPPRGRPQAKCCPSRT